MTAYVNREACLTQDVFQEDPSHKERGPRQAMTLIGGGGESRTNSLRRLDLHFIHMIGEESPFSQKDSPEACSLYREETGLLERREGNDASYGGRWKSMLL